MNGVRRSRRGLGRALSWTLLGAAVVGVVAIGIRASPGRWNSSGGHDGSDEGLGGDSAARRDQGSVAQIGGLDNVETAVFALGSVWAVTSNRSDAYSQQPLRASVIRIEPTTGSIDEVLDSPGVAPMISELDGHVWVNLVDRMVALDAEGSVVASIPFSPNRPGDHLASNHHLWVVDVVGATVAVIEPRSASIVQTIDTGAAPLRPAAAFGHIWIPSITDGTVTIIDEARRGDSAVIAPFVSSNWLKTITAVPSGRTGDEVWVTDVSGDVFAINAEGDTFGDVRKVAIDTSINRVHVHEARAFLLPVFGLDVLVLDLETEEVVTRIRIESIPFRAAVAHDLVWVASDGPREQLTVIDPATMDVRRVFSVGTNESKTSGPQQPLQVDGQIWVPNRGDDALFIVDAGDV